jgi:glucosamine--fructose-6-phosphate aminotransferase (isomerizing)
MCGIIAVLRRACRRAAPSAQLLTDLAAQAERALALPREVQNLSAAADALSKLDRELKGPAGLWALLRDKAVTRDLATQLAAMQSATLAFEQSLDQTGVTDTVDPAVELRNAALLRLKDALWSVLRDRLPHAEAVQAVANGELPDLAAAAAFSGLQTALSALDRLEVRGRDSAGVSVIVSGLSLDTPAFAGLLAGRSDDPLFQNGSVRLADGCLNLVYKHSAEIGELGDNVRALRASMQQDRLLQAAPAGSRRRSARARPHALGQRRHHQRAKRAPAQSRRDDERAESVRDRRAQRRRRQPPRSDRAASPRDPRSDHD